MKKMYLKVATAIFAPSKVIFESKVIKMKTFESKNSTFFEWMMV